MFEVHETKAVQFSKIQRITPREEYRHSFVISENKKISIQKVYIRGFLLDHNFADSAPNCIANSYKFYYSTWYVAAIYPIRSIDGKSVF